MQDLQDSLSFDEAANLYDETRRADSQILDLAFDYIATAFPPDRYRTVFEPGIGTGRIAIPLASRGYQVTGVDISPKMLALLQRKLSSENRALSIAYQVADVTSLPIADGQFDISIIVHLFYFIPKWKVALAEIVRVLRRGAPIVLMHTGTGAEVPFMNDRYRAICKQNGYDITNVGATSTADVVQYLEAQGFSSQHVSDSWVWNRQISIETALAHFSKRAYSFTLRTPVPVHNQAVETLQGELAAQFGALTHEILVPNRISIVILRMDNQENGRTIGG